MEGRERIAVGIAPTEQPPVGRAPALVGPFRAEEATPAAAAAAAAAKEYTSSTPSPSTSPTPSPPSAAAPPAWAMGSEGRADERGGKPGELAAEGGSGNHGMQMSLSSGRRRGRPRGSGPRQILATLGEWYALSAGGSFTPHVLTIAAGEDVAARVMSFSQKGPRSVCILAANGAISNVTLRLPGSSAACTFTYEGRFEILQLCGSFTIAEEGNGRRRSGGLSVSLAGPDGRVLGGGVAGLLRAASPIQVVVGSFLPNSLKQHKRRASLQESSSSAVAALPAPPGVLTAAMPISQAAPDNGCQVPPVSAARAQPHGHAENSGSSSAMTTNPTATGFAMVGWPVSSQSLGHKASPDINVCLTPQE